MYRYTLSELLWLPRCTAPISQTTCRSASDFPPHTVQKCYLQHFSYMFFPHTHILLFYFFLFRMSSLLLTSIKSMALCNKPWGFNIKINDRNESFHSGPALHHHFLSNTKVEEQKFIIVQFSYKLHDGCRNTEHFLVLKLLKFTSWLNWDRFFHRVFF